jgi:hypothetical protein
LGSGIFDRPFFIYFLLCKGWKMAIRTGAGINTMMWLLKPEAGFAK